MKIKPATKLSAICNCSDCRKLEASRYIVKMCVTGAIALIVLAAGLKAAAGL